MGGRLDHMDERFDKLEEKVDYLPTKADVQKWGDNNLVPYQRDMDRLKFLHIDELKNIVDNLTISKTLVDEGLN